MIYIVPIDACYQLVGLIRLSWKGLSGGEEVWRAVEEFFVDLQAKSQPVMGVTPKFVYLQRRYYPSPGRSGSQKA